MNLKFVILLVCAYFGGHETAELGDLCGGPCGLNEVCNACSSVCGNTCEDPSPPCPAMCGPPSCECQQGYVRDAYHNCIALKDCPSRAKTRGYGDPCGGPCGENEVCVECSLACNKTCGDPNPQCSRICQPPKCQCLQGYVRNDQNHCIPLNKCPARPSNCGLSCGNPYGENKGCRGCSQPPSYVGKIR